MTPEDAVHRDIEAFVSAGIKPYRALLAATRGPAEYLGITDSVGTVAVGKRADLSLVEPNPLDGIGNLRKVAGVMSVGRWYDASALVAIRATVSAHVQQ